MQTLHYYKIQGTIIARYLIVLTDSYLSVSYTEIQGKEQTDNYNDKICGLLPALICFECPDTHLYAFNEKSRRFLAPTREPESNKVRRVIKS